MPFRDEKVIDTLENNTDIPMLGVTAGGGGARAPVPPPPAESAPDYSTCIGIFESSKCDVNPQPNTRGIGSLVGRTSGNRRSVMHVLAVIFSITYHFFFICQYIFIQVILSGREIYPLLMYPSTFLVF